MSSSYRGGRRQGIVYGPVPPQRGGRGVALLGTLLGVLVVLVAFGLLALGAFALVGGDIGSTPSPLPSGAALPSSPPSPSGSVSPFGSSSPAASAPASGAPTQSAIPTGVLSPSPSPTGTPQPTFTPVVNVGPGWVTFGTKVDQDLKVTDARATFSNADARIVWSAYLSQPANGKDLTILILKFDSSAPNGEKQLWNTPVRLNVTNAQIFQSHLRTRTALDGPGLYEVRYVRGGDVLAHGFFEYTG